MKNKSHSIKTIFIKKMAYSAFIQFFVFGLILLLAKEYFDNNQIGSLSKNLIINDSFTTDEIGRYQLLNNKHALDLALYNLENERKLDSIKFVSDQKPLEDLGTCQSISGKIHTICKADNGQFSGITAIKKDDQILGYVISKKQYNSIFLIPASHGLLLILITVIGIFLFNFLFLFLSMRKTIANSTGYLLDFISSHQNNNATEFSKVDIDEYRQIATKFIEEHSQTLSLQKEKAYYDARKKIAEQVAHDIRSPLAAINTALSDVTSISENKRIMIRNAAKRINDIANNILSQSKHNSSELGCNDLDGNILPELIFVVLDNIVSEKRYEYHNSKIDIQLKVSPCCHSCFSNINLVSFKRVLSNLINNSIEAIDCSGFVIISLRCDNDQVEITIEDNGCGIPSEILPQVTEQGFSFNKKNGAGFGLSYSKKYIGLLNGKIELHSEVGIGTKVTIFLPRANPPDWFCEALFIKNQSVIIVLDDDPSIHEAWNEKFIGFSDFRIVHFYNASDLTLKKLEELKPDIYLIDYELLADNKNGLDLIAELELKTKAFLVTSCFEDLTVRNRCKKLDVRIIPKPYVPFIKINLCHQILSNAPFVFIDDDEMMRTTWAFAASDAGTEIALYSSIDEFMGVINDYTNDTIIYIDSDLDNNIKGEVEAKKLFDLGFTEIHLATGHSPKRFENIPWLKSIVGKSPPF